MWRQMQINDMDGVIAVSHIAFPDYPEARHFFEERHALSPETCFVYVRESDVKAYLVSYPWKLRDIPSLNTRLGELPSDPDCIYIHDLALHPDIRGTGASSEAIERLLEAVPSVGVTKLALMAVNGSVSFWERHGFTVVHDETLKSQIEKYGANAFYMVRELK